MSRSDMRKRRKVRIRKKISGTAERPRLAIFRSNRHIRVQLINDELGVTLAAASSEQIAPKSGDYSSGSVTAAKDVGEEIGKKAAAIGIAAAVSDRGGNLYHGRVAALVEAAREQGLKI